MKLLSIFIFFSLRIYRKSLKLSHKIKWKRKVKRLIRLKGSKKLTNDQKQDIKAFYAGFNLHKISSYWHQYYYSCNGQVSVEYIPEDLFYVEMEPNLNRTVFVDVLADKNLLATLFPEVAQPQTVFKNINGFYYCNDELVAEEYVLKLCETDFEMVIKPTLDTGGGKNVIVFKCSNGLTNWRNYSLIKLLKGYKKDYIVQKLVEQHSKMKVLNSTSLNTFRVMSYLTGNKVDILSIIVRMGKEGSRTDNSTGGGLSCGVNPDGTLKRVGYNNNTGNSFTETEAGIKFEDIKLPFMEQINRTVIDLHKRVPYFRLISWDLAIDVDEKVILIEYNIKGQDINFHQLNNGPVLKELLTDHDFR